ncbi:autoinducer binding domain-containing protein [Pseudomonas sp. PSKL.D1]|uniref:autoinducer binding domain-containing protein n=1 Tax=Pseudomonas sp. PSKL.D1 TaxID=3029060 RepID=UPI0023810AAC|nr:autoinducer binding domain-containing protein [Pseudomonas sp. PSKL.D1]WDY58765.1 autoinducer binding domain-containing protein [Pseudomonas sp. PSKL.D1]
MSLWNYEHLHQLISESTPQRAFDVAVHLAQDLDMEYLGLKVRLQLAAQAPKLYLYSNYSAAWVERYQHEDFYKQDSAACVSHTTTMPVLWTDDLYREAPDYRQEACQHGLRHGWTQSLHDMQHHESQLSIARPFGEVSIHELYEKGCKVQWLCHTLHAIISEYHLNSLCPSTPKFTERELDVLKWSADGKTAAVIARILSLSPSTVNFHIRSVITKTNASNKAGAIAIAAMRGLL